VPHMVIYRSAEGKPAYHQTEELADAASFVERIRNEDAIESARIFRLDEIIFDYKTVYRVRISGNDELAGRAPAERPAPVAPPVATPAQVPASPAPPQAMNEDPRPIMDQRVTAAPNPTVPASVADDLSSDAGDGTGNGSRRGLFGR